MAGDVVGAHRTSGCTGAAPHNDPPEQTAELARQRKRDANARHRARKKAMAGLEQAMAQVQLDSEKLRGAELAAAHAAMSALKEYQEEALRVLQFASLTENVDGEVALVDVQDFAVLDSTRMAALLAAEQQRAQRRASSDSEGSEDADDTSGAQSSRAGAAAPQRAAAPTEPASAAASACSGGAALETGGGAAGASRTASAAAASAAAAPPGGAEPCHSGKLQAGAAAAGPAAGPASASQSAGDTGGDAASAAEQREFVSDWLAHVDGLARNWRAAQVPEVRSTFVRVAAAALNFMSTQVISQRNREFTVQLQHMVQRWEACPSSRREIEEQIAGRLATRCT